MSASFQIAVLAGDGSAARWIRWFTPRLTEAAAAIESAVAASIADGHRTGEIRAASDAPALSTSEMGQAIVTHLLHP
ncbi:MAG: hypothetical protein EA424_19450 [Planctomycetaceae bacterium]|nr:MAG: hypothetical protein EA424_19450 [Planctomycetaceae bacterium]